MKSWTLTAKLYTSGLTFLVLALTSIGITLWVTWNLEGGAAAVNEAGRMRMQTYRLALAASSSGPSGETLALIRSFDASVALLRSGDPSRPLFVPWSEDSRQRFRLIAETWHELRAQWTAERPSPQDAARDAGRFVALIDGFVAAIETQMSRSTTLLQGVQLAMMGLAIAGVVAMLYAGYLFVLNPLARLKRGLTSVQRGDLSTRVEVDTLDEFGQLSAGFNEMAQTLQSLYGSLEDKVREKTARLEVKRQRLADLYEASAFLAKAPSLDALARGFASQVRRIAKADGAAVRWSDEGNQRYLLLAADGLPAALLQSEACLDTGTCLCGQRRAQASIRTIPIVPDPAASMGYCQRAGFRTLISVPVKLHDRVLGEVDLFFRAPVALEDEDRDLLDTLATHLASAMESLRAAALEREAAVAQERALLAQELHDSIAQSLAFLKIQVQLLRDAMRREDSAGDQRHHRRAGGRRARELRRRARTAGALPHPHQRGGHRAGPAHDLVQVRAPDRDDRAPGDGRPRRAAGAGRAGAGAAHHPGGAVQRAQARRRARGGAAGVAHAALALRGAGRRPRLRRRCRPRG